jgi:hypothetical protein
MCYGAQRAHTDKETYSYKHTHTHTWAGAYGGGEVLGPFDGDGAERTCHRTHKRTSHRDGRDEPANVPPAV